MHLDVTIYLSGTGVYRNTEETEVGIDADCLFIGHVLTLGDNA